MKHYITIILMTLGMLYLIAALTACEALPEVPEIPGVNVKGQTTLPHMKPEWSKVMLEEIEAQLPKLEVAKRDMTRRFCPNYESLTKDQRVVAWAHLATAIIYYESGVERKSGYFKTCSSMTEVTGDVSIGFFQLSYGNRFCPRNKSEGNLCDVKVNIACGVELMGHFVSRDAVVAAGGYVSAGASEPKGLAKYWAVIRVPDPKPRIVKGKKVQRAHKLKEISALAMKAPGCK